MLENAQDGVLLLLLLTFCVGLSAYQALGNGYNQFTSRWMDGRIAYKCYKPQSIEPTEL
jgi:hypothetical protein